MRSEVLNREVPQLDEVVGGRADDRLPNCRRSDRPAPGTVQENDPECPPRHQRSRQEVLSLIRQIANHSEYGWILPRRQIQPRCRHIRDRSATQVI